MNKQTVNPDDERQISTLYQNLLDAWNRRSATDYAAIFQEDAHVVGFDGSMMNGKAEIETTLTRIFADHQTASYIGKIREIQFRAPAVALLRAVVGMVPHGKSEINPAVNAIQTLVGVKGLDGWKIALFQNTPAQFHGRPNLAEALTEELSQLLSSNR